MRHLPLVVGLVLLLAGLWFFFRGDPVFRGPRDPARPAPDARADFSPAEARRLVAEGQGTLATVTAAGIRMVPGVEKIAGDLNAPDHEPDLDLEILQNAVTEFRRIFGSNPPGGLNAEISAALTGRNDRRLAVISPDSPALNRDGELVDRWGTPFYFHPVTAADMEILSAGPDRLLWTPDDVGRIQPADNVSAPGR